MWAMTRATWAFLFSIFCDGLGPSYSYYAPPLPLSGCRPAPRTNMCSGPQEHSMDSGKQKRRPTPPRGNLMYNLRQPNTRETQTRERMRFNSVDPAFIPNPLRARSKATIQGKKCGTAHSQRRKKSTAPSCTAGTKKIGAQPTRLNCLAVPTPHSQHQLLSPAHKPPRTAQCLAAARKIHSALERAHNVRTTGTDCTGGAPLRRRTHVPVFDAVISRPEGAWKIL